MELQTVTISVSDLEKSKSFYETILGFKIYSNNEPTKWVSFQIDTNSFFAIQEQDNIKRIESAGELDFLCDDIAELWNRIKNKVEIVEELHTTDWGAYKFVIKDIDGQKLGFIQKSAKNIKKVKFDMIGIFVGNLRAMVDFYKNVIGIEIDWDGNGPYAEFKHDGIRFSMYERKELPHLLGQTPEYPLKLNGTFELAINVGKPENVDVKFQEIISKGAKEIYPPRNEPWKMRSAMLTDPEGNIIEIASDFWT